MNHTHIQYARSTLPADSIYADWAASALPLSVASTSPFIAPYHSSSHSIQSARLSVLNFLGDHHHQFNVIFTSNATSSFELLARRLPWSSSSTLILHQHVHNSVSAIQYPARNAGANCQVFTTNQLNTIVDNTSNHNYNNVHKQQLSSSSPPFVLFAYPSECNLTGSIYPSSWGRSALDYGICGYDSSNTIVLIDTVKTIASAPFDPIYLNSCHALAISFYKLSGNETGLGALLIRKNSLLETLLISTQNHTYFSGPLSSQALSVDGWRIPSNHLETQFQLGTPHLHAIHRLPSLLKLFQGKGFQQRAQNAQQVGKLFANLMQKQFGNRFVRLVDQVTEHVSNATISFTLYRQHHTPVGYGEIITILNVNNVFARAGCMCNAGACSSVLNLSQNDLIQHYKLGHVCGDANDIINGQPTGVVRISFGWGSEKEDAISIVRILNANLYLDIESIQKEISFPRASFIVERMYIYPVKSCGGYEVPHCVAEQDGGLKGDRVFGIEQINSGKILTVKSCIRMAGISARYTDEGKKLVLDWTDEFSKNTDKDEIEIDISSSLSQRQSSGIEERVEDIENKCEYNVYDEQLVKRQTVECWKSRVWLSSHLQTECKLVYLNYIYDTRLSKRNLLVVEATDVNYLSKLSGLNYDILLAAIRPSILLKPASSTYTECSVTDIGIYDHFDLKSMRMKRQRICHRCRIVNIISKWKCGIDTGEPLKSIAMYNKQKKTGKLSFGQIAKMEGKKDTDEVSCQVEMNVGDGVIASIIHS